MTLARLEKILDDTDSTLTRWACDSDSTKVTRAHHCWKVLLRSLVYMSGNDYNRIGLIAFAHLKKIQSIA